MYLNAMPFYYERPVSGFDRNQRRDDMTPLGAVRPEASLDDGVAGTAVSCRRARARRGAMTPVGSSLEGRHDGPDRAANGSTEQFMSKLRVQVEIDQKLHPASVAGQRLEQPGSRYKVQILGAPPKTA